MIIALALFVAIVIGGLVGMLVTYDAGYVMVHFGDWVVETSVWVALLTLLAVYLLMRAIAWSVGALLKGQIGLMQWRSGHRARTARQQTVRGLLLMAEGRWEEAKKVFLQGVSHVETPLINYLNAARAAHELGDAEERDGLLKRAHETTPGAKFAALLTQAEFQVKDGRFEQALAALLSLRKNAPKHRSVLKMLGQCYEALGDWQGLHDHLKELSDNKAVNEAEIRRLSQLVWQSKVVTEDDVAALWKKMPKRVRSDVALICLWVDSLVSKNLDNEAEQALQLALEQTWHEELVERYGLVGGDQAAAQLATAKGWLKNRSSDAVLHVALGRLSLRNEQFEEGREYFEAALRLEPSDTTYAELGRLCIALGDERRGADYLLRSVGGLPHLPRRTSAVGSSIA